MKPKEFITKEIHITETIQIFPDPPTNLKSTFKTIENWLTDILLNEKPGKPIGRFEFCLSHWEMGRRHGYTLAFAGYNDYGTSTNVERKIDFEPANMFFPLPKTDYENLDYEQVVQKLIGQVKDFTNTEVFKKFHAAYPGALYFNGRDINLFVA